MFKLVNFVLSLLMIIMITLSSVTTVDDSERKYSSSEHTEAYKHQLSQKNHVHEPSERITRQNKLSKSAIVKPPTLASAITSLLGGTVTDTFTAYRNVTKLIRTAFAPPKQTIGNATGPVNATQYFTFRQAVGLLRRNYRGLRRLFDNEFTKALNDSMKTALEFRRELKKSANSFLEFNGAMNNV